MSRPQARAPQARAIAAPTVSPMGRMLRWSGVAVIASMAVLAAGAVKAQDITITHGYSNFGELKYPAEFDHLDYVNPDAPKGGEISTWSLGTRQRGVADQLCG